MISLKANCIDSTLDANTVIVEEMNKMKKEGLKRKERLTLEPFERDHAVVCTPAIACHNSSARPPRVTSISLETNKLAIVSTVFLSPATTHTPSQIVGLYRPVKKEE